MLDGQSTFGGYRLSSRLATGGMAEVYLARKLLTDGNVGRLVALKRLLPHLMRDANIVRMFLNEARITAQIHHQNVVRIVDIGHHEGEPFIAMELLEGRSFAELRQRAALSGERVPLGITLRVLTDACRGLDAAHRAVDPDGKPLSIVHRDFSPDNIHVGVQGDVKVIDFGIAKAENLGSGTEPGTLKGKFFYMSPEMILGRPVDHRADLFAAGVMLYEQLCGRRPFSGETTDQVLNRIAEGKPKRPSQFDPSVPPELEEICLLALSRNPDQRFASLEVFIQAIEAVGGRSELAGSSDVGAYVQRLFPDDDPKRQALRQAREADPSVPSSRAPSGVRERSTPPKATAAPAPVLGPPPAGLDSGPTAIDPRFVAPPAQGVGIRIPAGAQSPRAKVSTKLSPKLKLAITAGVLAIAGAGAWVLKPDPPPLQRLARAQVAQEAGGRATHLAPLGDDARATADDLARALHLLAEVGAHQAALDLAEALSERHPTDARGALAEARASIALRYGKRAEAAIARAASLAPQSADPDVLLADLREAQGDLPGAIDALAKARAKAPGDAALAGRHGVLLSQAARLDEAAEALGAALKGGFAARPAAELAFVRFRQDRLSEARGLLARAIRQDPQEFLARYYLGAVLFRQGDVAGAEREYREADRLAPQDPRALTALCEVQAHRGRGADDTRAELERRFPTQAASLTARCAAP